jgi:hypothetical protein
MTPAPSDAPPSAPLGERRPRRRLLLLLLALPLLGLLPGACTSVTKNRDPKGEVFPVVRGADLKGTERTIPTEFQGRPVLLLVGYVQDTQFDIDRWLFGLLQAKTPVAFLELPTIPDLIPSMISGVIDDGMRAGIPSEDWQGVVTLYSDEGERVRQLTGNESPRNGRVLLLDGEGRVVWFHDRGYSPRVMLELDQKIRALSAAPTAEAPPAKPANNAAPAAKKP